MIKNKFLLLLVVVCYISTIVILPVMAVAGGMVLVSGSASRDLAEKISGILGKKLSPTKLGRFNDGEISIQYLESLRGKDVYIIQSTSKSNTGSVNDSLVELYLMIRALRRASVNSVTAIIPYYGYARQDRKLSSRVPISASDVAMMLEVSGVDRIVAVDLHAGQIQGFFHKVPVDNLQAATAFVKHIIKMKLKNIVVVSPDAGGVARAKTFRTVLKNNGVDSAFALLVKEREKAGVVKQATLIGNVKGKNVIIVDDIVDTAGTLTAAAKELKAAGAKRIFACITHPVLSGPAHERIADSVFEQVIVSDSINLNKKNKKITQVSIASLLAETIKRCQNGESVSCLFNDKDVG